MKKDFGFKGALIGLLGISCLLTGCSSASELKQDIASITVNGKKTEGIKVASTDDQVYVPVDALKDSLGLYTNWDDEKKNLDLSKTPIDVGEHQTITFYITRHGETVFNEKHLAQGWCDSPLTEKGIRIAEKLGKSLKDVPFVAAYSSVSERASDTAEAALEGRNLEVQLTDGLKEMYYGTMEGGTNEEMEEIAKKMNLDTSYFFKTNGFDVLGGETWDEVGQRMENELNMIAETYSPVGGNVLIATHGMSIQALLRQICSPNDPALKAIEDGVENCSITIVEWNDGKFTVKTANDTSYIK